MKRLIITAMLLVTFLVFHSAYSDDQSDQWLAIPGKQVGPISKDSTEVDLIKLFGKENVEDVTIGQPEGMFEKGTIVFPNDPTKAFKVIWQDKELKQRPVEVIVNDERTTVMLDEAGAFQGTETRVIKNSKSLWHTPEGITLGMPVSKLEKLNGKPFLMTAHTPTCIPIGVVSSWNGGKLDQIPRFFVKLGQEKWDGSLDNGGHELIQSDHFRIRKSDLKVVDMTFSVGNDRLPEPEVPSEPVSQEYSPE